MTRKLLLASVAVVFAVAPAAAQTQADQDRQVTVRLDNILQEMAADLDLPDALLPDEVDVPGSVAAEVCGLDAAALTADAESGRTSCTAVTLSPELTRFVQEEMVVDGQPADTATDLEEPDRAPLDGQIDQEVTGTPGRLADDLDDPTAEGEDEGDPAATGAIPEAPAAVEGDDALDVAPSDLREQPSQPPEFGTDPQPQATPPPVTGDATPPASPGLD